MKDTPTAPLLPAHVKNAIKQKHCGLSNNSHTADRWRLIFTQSVGDARLNAVRKNVRDSVFMLGFGQNYNPNVPQSVNRHLEVTKM